MRHILEYSAFEDQISKFVSIYDLVKQNELSEVGFVEFFKQSKNQPLNDIHQDSNFLRIFNEKGLRLGPLYQLEEQADIVKEDGYICFLIRNEPGNFDPEQFVLIDTDGETKMFRNDDGLGEFIQSLSYKKIEIKPEDEPNKTGWIYQTSNAGKNWFLLSRKEPNEKFKKNLMGEDIQNILEDGFTFTVLK